MVTKENYDHVKKIIKTYPNLPFGQILEKIQSSEKYLSRGTFNNALKELIDDKVVGNLDKKYFFIGEIKNIRTELLNTSKLTKSRITNFILKLYTINKLNQMDLEPLIIELCKNYVNSMNEHFENPEYEEEMKRYYNKESIQKIQMYISELKTSYKRESSNLLIKAKEPLTILYFVEKSIKDQLKINIESRKDIFLSDKSIESFYSRIIDVIFENIILNPEFLNSVESLGDLKFKLEISYDPLDLENFFNLNFLSDKVAIIDELKDLIFDYNLKDKTLKNTILDNAKAQTKRRNERILKLERFETILKKYFWKLSSSTKLERSKVPSYEAIKADIYFLFKEKIKKSWDSLDLAKIAKKAIEMFNKEIKKVEQGEKPLLQKIADSFRQSFRDAFDEEFEELEKNHRYPEMIDLIGERLTDKTISKKERTALYITLSAIFCNDLENYTKALEIVKEGFKYDRDNPLIFVNEAMIYYNQGNLEEALESIEKGLKINENNDSLLFKKSYLLKQKGELQSALDILSKIKASEEIPINMLYELKIYILEEQQDYRSIIDVLNKLSNIYTEEVEYYERKCWIYIENLDEFDKGLEAINKAIELEPGNIGFYVDKSKILCDYFENYTEALKIVNEALKKEEKNLNLYINKAIILNNLGEFEEAIKALNDAESIDQYNKFDINILSRKCYILTNMGNLEGAFAVFKRAVKSEPYNVDFILSQHDLICALNKFDEVIEFLERAMEKTPNHIELINELLDLYIRTDKKRNLYKAINLADEVLQSGVSDVMIYMQKSLAYVNQVKPSTTPRARTLKYKKALDVVNKALQVYENDAELYSLKSSIFFLQKMFKEALIEIEKAIERDNVAFEYIHTKAVIYYELGEFSEALKSIKQVIKLNPEFSKAMFLKAQIFNDTDKFRKAVEVIDELIESEPDEFIYYHEKARIYFNMKEHVDAIKAIERALELSPEDFESYYLKALILSSKGDTDKAVEALNIAVKLKDELYNYQYQEALIFFEMKKYQKALGQINEVISLYECDELTFEKDSFRYYDLKVTILKKMKKYSEALPSISKAIELNPDERILYVKQYRLYKLNNEIDQAIQVNKKILDKVSNIKPLDKHFINNLLNDKALMLSKKGDKTSITIIEGVLENDIENEAYRDSYGLILMNLGNFKEALVQFERIIKEKPRSKILHEVYINLGECQKEHGNLDEAKASLEIGLKIAQKKNKSKWIKKAKDMLINT